MIQDTKNPLPSYDASSVPSSLPMAVAGPSTMGLPQHAVFASITLNLSDRLRMIKFPYEDIDPVRRVIDTYWEASPSKRGVQEERIYGGAQEFKLKGYPWMSTMPNGGKLRAANLLCRILETLYNRGWLLTMSSDVSGKDNSKDTLFFRRRSPPPPPCHWMFITFDMSDIMRLSNVPKDAFDAILNIISNAYPIKKHQWVEISGTLYPTHEIKFHGFPLMPNGEATVQLRMFCLTLLEAFESLGFSLYGSIAHNMSGSEGQTTDSWFFTRPQQWSPGMPAY